MASSDTSNLVKRSQQKDKGRRVNSPEEDAKDIFNDSMLKQNLQLKGYYSSKFVNCCYFFCSLLAMGFATVTFIINNNMEGAVRITTEGGWDTSNRLPDGPCNIPRIDASKVSQGEFLQRYAKHTPVIIEGTKGSNSAFRKMCERDNLMTAWGHATVRLSSANTYSYGTKDVTLKHYIDTMVKPQDIHTPANETFYFFGYNDMEEWADFFSAYKLPPYELPGHTHALSFGLAGPGSGVPFHFHGPGFAETLHGRKRWFLTPPDVQPEFNPNKTTLQWLKEDYHRISEDIYLSECTLRPGEIIFFPDRWWHATLNLDTAVFISTFLSP